MRIPVAILSIVIALLIVALASGYFLKNRLESTAVRAIEPQTIFVETEQGFEFEIVASAEARIRGLSGRAEVPANYGMLFVFPEANRHGFWMKDMLVPIDIIWLADDGTIIGIDAHISPDTYPTAFYAPQPVTRVLEVGAGEAEAQGWVVGGRIELPV